MRHKFFGVGDVIVETAGNAKPVVLRVIREPEAVYAGLRERMRKNGCDLTQRQLLHEEQPAIIGILGECLGLLGGAFALGIFVVSMIAEVRGKAPYPALEATLYGFLGLAVFGIVAFIIVRCLDFRRLKNGVALSAAIDQLVVLARQKEKPAARSTAGDPALASRILPRRTEPEATPIGETLVGEFKMDAARTLVPLLILLPLFPLWIAAMIQSGIRLASTRYFVRSGSLRHSYKFLTVNEREFAYDKITGLVIKQNLLDHMFGTMTLRFWSIGSGKPLEFAHVHANQINLPALMRQAGIPAASPEPYEARASFGIPTWLRARLKILPLLLFLAAGIVFAAIQVDPAFYWLLATPVLIGLIALIHGMLYYSRNVSIMTAGSSKPDLNLIDSPAYLKMYEVIRERSQ